MPRNPIISYPDDQQSNLDSNTRDAATTTKLVDAGLSAESRGDLASAERLYRQAIEVDPDSPSAHMNLGIVLFGKGETAAAAAEHALAASLDPAMEYAHYNLGLARLQMYEFDAAETALREALRLRPRFPEAWVALADVLESSGREVQAVEALDAAIEQRPGYAGAIFNVAALLRRLGRLDEAVARLRRVPSDHPDAANVLTALGAILRDQGQIEESIATMRAVLDRQPDSGVAQCELLFTLGMSDRISAEALFAEHLWAGCRAEYEVTPWCAVFSNRRDPERTLRVGYLSGDFRGQAVSLFTESLFERQRGDAGMLAYAYSSNSQHDATTARIMRSIHAWRDVQGQSDANVAQAILADEIDILVDLAGHTGFQRIGVLAGRAAPIQMTWLGYLHSTGLTRIDYRISDAHADPHDTAAAFHTEKLLHLPNAQWCFRPPEIARNLAVERKCTTGAFTFGSFNQFPKVSDQSLRLWIEVLRHCPESRLRIAGVPRGSTMNRLAALLTAEGIGRSRFDLVERLPLDGYYEGYNHVDACLDSTPYSGGTTTCDAFWMGVPVITLAGTRSMSRSSASLLACVGLQEMIAYSDEEFTAIAARVASSGPRNGLQRLQLRKRMLTSPLMDEEGFAQDLESLYRRAWRLWCEARPLDG